jgi:uncharacterized RDD family membrane protein YckC
MNYQEYLELTESIDKVLSRRCYAAILDYIVFYSIIHIYAHICGMTIIKGIPQIHGLVHYFAVFFIWIFYFPFMEARFGYTLGKGLFHLKVCFNRKNHFLSSVLRHVVDVFDFMFFGAVAIVLIKYTPGHKRIGDYLGKTKIELENN